MSKLLVGIFILTASKFSKLKSLGALFYTPLQFILASFCSTE